MCGCHSVPVFVLSGFGFSTQDFEYRDITGENELNCRVA